MTDAIPIVPVAHVFPAMNYRRLGRSGLRVSGFVRTPLTSRNTFRMPFLVEVDYVAERIVRGLEEGEYEIHFPAPLSWTMKALRVLPASVYARIIRRAAPRSAHS